MVDMVKKVNKKSEFLDLGETVLAASAVGEVGQFQKVLAAGNGVLARADAHRNADRAPALAAGTLSASWPALKAGILAVTDQRLILFEQSKLHFGPTGVAGSWPRQQIAGVTVAEGKASTLVNIQFSDGSTAQMESIVTAKPELLAAAFVG